MWAVQLRETQWLNPLLFFLESLFSFFHCRPSALSLSCVDALTHSWVKKFPEQKQKINLSFLYLRKAVNLTETSPPYAVSCPAVIFIRTPWWAFSLHSATNAALSLTPAHHVCLKVSFADRRTGDVSFSRHVCCAASGQTKQAPWLSELHTRLCSKPDFLTHRECHRDGRNLVTWNAWAKHGPTTISRYQWFITLLPLNFLLLIAFFGFSSALSAAVFWVKRTPQIFK